jgi:2-oxoglutarate ferredoxin oxidoreductase subunit gamma
MAKIGKPIVLNICMLGAVIALTELVKPESIIATLTDRIPDSFLEMNRNALELGMELGRNNK